VNNSLDLLSTALADQCTVSLQIRTEGSATGQSDHVMVESIRDIV
jgi:hypothetical protein